MLNKLMLENNYISNIGNINQDEGLNYKIDIHFFVNKKDFEMNNNEMERKLVHSFLFSNRLKYKDANHENCTVEIHKL